MKITRQDDSAEFRTKVANEKQKRDADGPPLGALLVNVDVGHREIRARRVGRPAKRASDHHAFNGPMWREQGM